MGSTYTLQTLELHRTEVTGAGLKDLAGLKQLRTLDLKGPDKTYAAAAVACS
jgi:hypothetical protein